MKIIAILPDRETYKFLRSKLGQQPGVTVSHWADRETPAIQVVGVGCDPFDGKPHEIVLSQQHQKSDASRYPYRLVLKVFPSAKEGDRAILQRETVKGVYGWNQQHPEYGWPQFYAIPTDRPKFWVCYSIWRVH